MEKYNKLVRDKIPEHLDTKGLAYEQRIASLVEFKQELIKKLGEEISEFTETPTAEELADILEVIEALKKLPEFSEVDSIKARKLAERGGFEKRIILKGERG